MSEKFSRDPLRGMKDFYPDKLREVRWILSVIEEIADLYSYEEFEGPLLEPIEIFAAKSSEELVNEQSFVVEKKEGERLILRPELTPTLARMIARKSQEIKKPIRWYSNPKCYRYERPQKGRRREFLQVNFDILGEDSLYAEIEIFNIAVDILTSFGATEEQFQIYYNNRRFLDAVCKYILQIPQEKMPRIYKVLDKSDKMEEDEFEKFAFEEFHDDLIVHSILKLKDADSVEELLDKFDNETIPDAFYESKGYKEIEKLEKLLLEVNLSPYCSFSSSIVRGLDYYTGTVFEVFDTGSENTRAIFGGGRYDDLLSLFSDEQLSGMGFGMGILMLRLFLRTYDLIPPDIREKDYTNTVYISSISEKVSSYAIEVAQRLREESFPCIIDYKFKSLKSQISKANELGVWALIIIGPKEMAENQVTVKNMITEKQITVDVNSLVEEIDKIFEELDEAFSEVEEEDIEE